MGTRTVAILLITLAMALLFLGNSPAAPRAHASQNHDEICETYGTPVTPPIYLINFLFLYTANPQVAANLPAYRAPIPQPLVDCLNANPTGCSWADYEQYFNPPPASGDDDSQQCHWPRQCLEVPKYERLAPRKYTDPSQINEPLGLARAKKLAQILGIQDDVVLTNAEYQCMLGTPSPTPDQQTISMCIRNLTNSIGNSSIPLSSYGLSVTDAGIVQSDCAPGAPCLEFNALLAGPLEKIAAQCGFLQKFVRMTSETPFYQFALDGTPCQSNSEPACIVTTVCPNCK